MKEHAAPHWEHFAHEADIGIRGIGPDLPGAFQQVATALTAVVVDPGRVRPLQSRSFECSAPDRELLLVEWLDALIYSMAADSMLYSKFEIEIDTAGNRLRARAWGEKLDVGRHRPAVEIKGATLTELSAAQQEDGNWRAQCVVDV